MVIGISGCIASGKSTLSYKLSEYYKNSFLLEEFSNDDPIFNTFLKWIYENKPNLDIGFQSYIVESLTTNFIEQEKIFLKSHSHKNNFMFLDRFTIEHYVFAVVTLENKPKKYLKAFDALFEKIVDLSTSPDFAIYLDMNWETFKKRIFERARQVEMDNWEIQKDYFKRLHELYKDVYIKVVERFNIPYTIINVDNLTEQEVLQKAIEIIEKFDFSKSMRGKNA